MRDVLSVSLMATGECCMSTKYSTMRCHGQTQSSRSRLASECRVPCLTAETERGHSAGHRKAGERDGADDSVPWQQNFKLVGMMISNVALSEERWSGETICPLG